MFPVTLSTGWCADRQRRTDKMIMRLETKKGLKEEKYIKINDQSPSAMSRWNVGLCRHYPNANISGSCGARPTGKSKFGREKHTHTRLLRGSRADFLVSPAIIIYFPSLKKKRRKGGIPGLNCQSIGVDCRSENGNKKKSQTQATAVSQRFASLQMNGLTGKYLLWLIEKNYNDHHECLERRPSLSCRWLWLLLGSFVTVFSSAGKRPPVNNEPLADCWLFTVVAADFVCLRFISPDFFVHCNTTMWEELGNNWPNKSLLSRWLMTHLSAKHCTSDKSDVDVTDRLNCESLSF